MFRQFGVKVGRLTGRDCEIPSVDDKVTRPHLDECSAAKFSDWQLVGAGQGPGRSEDLLCRTGRGAVGGAEIFGSGAVWPPARTMTRWLPAMT